MGMGGGRQVKKQSFTGVGVVVGSFFLSTVYFLLYIIPPGGQKPDENQPAKPEF